MVHQGQDKQQQTAAVGDTAANVIAGQLVQAPESVISSDPSSTEGGELVSDTASQSQRSSMAAHNTEPHNSSAATHSFLKEPQIFETLVHGSEPARDLTDVSHRLRKLEKAVKSHLLGPRVTGDASILAGSRQTGSATYGSPVTSRISERQHLRTTLSALKSDVADLAAKEVEAHMLQQRVARLEAAIGGLTLSPGFASGLSSFGGSVVGGPTLVSAPQTQRTDASPRLTRTPSGKDSSGFCYPAFLGHIAALAKLQFWSGCDRCQCIKNLRIEVHLHKRYMAAHCDLLLKGFHEAVPSPAGSSAHLSRSAMSAKLPIWVCLLLIADVVFLANRLSGMEGLMKELAQAQVVNTAVLQQIGGRLGTSPVPSTSPGQPLYSADAPGGSLRSSQGRPPADTAHYLS